MIEELDRADRLRLMKFVCSFAWADLQVKPEEVGFVARIFRKLELEDDDWDRVKSWLDVPPNPDAIDPTQIPSGHRKVYIELIEGIISADDDIDEMEREALGIFKQLLT